MKFVSKSSIHFFLLLEFSFELVNVLSVLRAPIDICSEVRLIDESANFLEP